MGLDNLVQGEIPEIYYDIAQDALHVYRHNDGVTWTMRRRLYRETQANPIVTGNDAILSDFEDNMENTSVQDFYDIEEAISNALKLDSPVIAQYANYTTAISQYMQDIEDIDSILANGPSSQDSASLIVQRDSLYNLLVHTAKDYQSLRDSIHSQQIVLAENALLLNAAATTTTVYEQNQKTVNAIFLGLFMSGTISNTQRTQLQNVADQCPYSGGDAVYQARALLNDTTSYDDITLCAVSQSNESTKQYHTKSQYKIHIYPNPLSDIDILHVVIPELKETAHIVVYNSLGLNVMEIETENTHNNIDMHELPAGAYVVILYNENMSHRLSSRSFTLIR